MFKSNLKSSKMVFKLFKQNVNSFCRSTEACRTKTVSKELTLAHWRPLSKSGRVIKTEVILFLHYMITGYSEKTLTGWPREGKRHSYPPELPR